MERLRSPAGARHRLVGFRAATPRLRGRFRRLWPRVWVVHIAECTQTKLSGQAPTSRFAPVAEI